MHWQLILKEFRYDIQHISVVDNIVADTLSIFLSTTFDLDDPSTTRDISWSNELFSNRVAQTVEGGYPLYLVLVHKEQQKDIRKINNKLSVCMWDQISSY